MAFNAEQLNIVLSAQTKDLRQELEKAQKRIKNFEGQSKQSLNGLGSSFNQLGAIAKRAAPFMAGFFSFELVKNAASMAKEIQNLSTVAGISIEQFQSMAFAADQFGVGQDKLADIIKDVNDKIGDFMQTGGGGMADFFENIAPKVGLTADAFRNLNGADALQLYVDSLQKAGVSQQEMTFYMEALASDASLLTPLLANNGEEMQSLGEKAKSLGIVLDEDLIRQTAQMDEVWSTVMSSMSKNFSAFAMYVINGFDNIFGFTAYGQRNILQRSLGDLTAQMDVLNAQIAEYEATGEINFNDFTGMMGAATNIEDARASLANVAAEIDAIRIQKQEIDDVLARLDSAKTSMTTQPSIGGGTKGGGGGGGKSEVEKAKEAFEKLMGSIDGATKAGNEFANAQKIVNDALKVGVITQQEADFALGVLANRMKLAKGEMLDLSSVAGVLESGLTDAFMAILDGTQSTKDAFKSMARAVISELYRVLVVQRLVGSIGTAKTPGKGILGFFGNMFPALKGSASGGALMAGQPSVVGEHGRELFVPSSAGRVLSVPQAKAAVGGGGGITVVQNINVSTGVQQTVRAEIKSLMPQIADSAKAAVLDAKRRGGAYGGAFA